MQRKEREGGDETHPFSQCVEQSVGDQSLYKESLEAQEYCHEYIQTSCIHRMQDLYHLCIMFASCAYIFLSDELVFPPLIHGVNFMAI